MTPKIAANQLNNDFKDRPVDTKIAANDLFNAIFDMAIAYQLQLAIPIIKKGNGSINTIDVTQIRQVIVRWIGETILLLTIDWIDTNKFFDAVTEEYMSYCKAQTADMLKSMDDNPY